MRETARLGAGVRQAVGVLAFAGLLSTLLPSGAVANTPPPGPSASVSNRGVTVGAQLTGGCYSYDPDPAGQSPPGSPSYVRSCYESSGFRPPLGDLPFQPGDSVVLKLSRSVTTVTVTLADRRRESPMPRERALAVRRTDPSGRRFAVTIPPDVPSYQVLGVSYTDPGPDPNNPDWATFEVGLVEPPKIRGLSARARQSGRGKPIRVRMSGSLRTYGRPCEGRVRVTVRAWGRPLTARTIAPVVSGTSRCGFRAAFRFPAHRLPRQVRPLRRRLVLRISTVFDGEGDRYALPSRPDVTRVRVRR